jgi:hypothetical protein
LRREVSNLSFQIVRRPKVYKYNNFLWYLSKEFLFLKEKQNKTDELVKRTKQVLTDIKY